MNTTQNETLTYGYTKGHNMTLPPTVELSLFNHVLNGETSKARLLARKKDADGPILNLRELTILQTHIRKLADVVNGEITIRLNNH